MGGQDTEFVGDWPLLKESASQMSLLPPPEMEGANCRPPSQGVVREF